MRSNHVLMFPYKKTTSKHIFSCIFTYFIHKGLLGQCHTLNWHNIQPNTQTLHNEFKAGVILSHTVEGTTGVDGTIIAQLEHG